VTDDVTVVACLEQRVDCLHMVQLMPPPPQNPIISYLIEIQSGFTFLVPVIFTGVDVVHGSSAVAELLVCRFTVL